MDFDRYTDRARGFIQAAQNLARARDHQQLTPLHLLQVLLAYGEGLAAGLMRAAGADPGKALAATEGALRRFPAVQGAGAGQFRLAAEFAGFFDAVRERADKAGDSYVTAERLLHVLSLHDGAAEIGRASCRERV